MSSRPAEFFCHKCLQCGSCCAVKEGIVVLTMKDSLYMKKRKDALPKDCLVVHFDGERYYSVLWIRQRCPFLTQKLRCDIYSYRPNTCRIFPYTWKNESLYIEDSCRGFGKGKKIMQQDVSWVIPLQEEIDMDLTKQDYFWRQHMNLLHPIIEGRDNRGCQIGFYKVVGADVEWI